MQLCNNADGPGALPEARVRGDRSRHRTAGAHPVLIDKFLLMRPRSTSTRSPTSVSPATRDGECVVCGVMEHIEQAGIHSGDSACAIPPHSLSPELVQEMQRQTRLLARRLGVCGLMNVQFAVARAAVYVLEVNPRASRTVPFVSKATGVPWAKVATAVMLGRSLRDVLWERGSRVCRGR